MVAATFSYPKERPLNQIYLVTILAGITVLHHRSFPEKWSASSKAGSSFLYSCVGIGVLICALGYVRLKAEFNLEKAGPALKQGNWQAAIDYIDKAYTPWSTIDPINHPILSYRGKIHYQAGQFQQAIDDMTKGLKDNPYYVNFYVSRGNAYFQLRNFEAAINDYNKVIEQNTFFIEHAHYSRGNSYWGNAKPTSSND